MIKVSVIVPVYKVPLEYLRGCLESLAAQTLQECEFLIVSDGAPEAECSICDKYTTKDSRFKFFKREHAGVSATRNYGIKQAQGEYTTFVDADDWIEQNALDLVYKYAQSNNSDLVFWDLFFEENTNNSDYTNFHTNNIPLLSPEQITFFQKSIIHAYQRKYLIPALTVCKLVKTDVIKTNNIFFDTNLVHGEDRVFNYRITQHLLKYSYLQKKLYHYRLHNSSTENSFHEKNFPHFIEFITSLNNISNNAYPQHIADETITCFLRSIYKTYQHNLSTKQRFQELLFLKQQIHKDPFHLFIQNATYTGRRRTEQIDIFLMKRRLSLFLTLRVIKARIIYFLHL